MRDWTAYPPWHWQRSWGRSFRCLVGLPTFRLRGPYFAIATIGVSEAVRVVMTNLAVTGGASGYRITEKGAFNQHLHFYMALGLAAGAVAISMWIRHSKLGLALISIREDEDAASDLGVNPYGNEAAGSRARRRSGRRSGRRLCRILGVRSSERRFWI